MSDEEAQVMKAVIQVPFRPTMSFLRHYNCDTMCWNLAHVCFGCWCMAACVQRGQSVEAATAGLHTCVFKAHAVAACPPLPYSGRSQVRFRRNWRSFRIEGRSVFRSKAKSRSVTP